MLINIKEHVLKTYTFVCVLHFDPQPPYMHI